MCTQKTHFILDQYINLATYRIKEREIWRNVENSSNEPKEMKVNLLVQKPETRPFIQHKKIVSEKFTWSTYMQRSFLRMNMMKKDLPKKFSRGKL